MSLSPTTLDRADATLRLDAVIVTQTEHIQWLAGPRYPWLMQAAAVLFRDGYLTLAAPKKPLLDAAADETVTYERNGTRRCEMISVRLAWSCWNKLWAAN